MASQQPTTRSGGPTTALERGAKGYVENLVLGGADGAVMPFMFRPEGIAEDISAKYGRVSALGMSFEYLPYEGTSNPSWSFDVFQNRTMILREIGASGDVEGYFRAREAGQFSTSAGASQKGGAAGFSQLGQISAGMERSRRFLQALNYPPRVGDGMAEAPPACLLVIPGIVSARCRLVEWRARYEQSDTAGNLVQWTVSVKFEGAPLEQMTMDDVLGRGLMIGRERA